MKIKDILTINLSEDIKNVIDLEDVSEVEIQSEIENYIVTDGLAQDYSTFVSTFTSNIVETGVWISGFYGSGKSYFGKLLGYLLNNRSIAGTPARDRILNRFTGLNDEALVKNELAKLNKEKCRVVFLDIAKQDTSKGLSFALFRNFLKALDLPENEHGLLLYQLMIGSGQSNIHELMQQKLGLKWSEIKTRLLQYAKATKDLYLKQGHSESDYSGLMTTIRRDMDQFSASRLKEELHHFLQLNPDEKVVFLFDEASEAINQKKFSLLDLEAVSEALSALRGRVWTIAIAQEKLDDVINNTNVSKAQLTKVTDRFKTKIHLEATEVDVIIRQRLLNKTPEGIQDLKNHYAKNAGKINEHAALSGTGISRTDTEVIYLTYYPFYGHQFNLLQNFLFGTKGYASTKVAARGMIITTYDILKRELQDREIFQTVTGWQITKQALPQPDVRLVNRYDNADSILRNTHSSVSGRKLLETIHFLSEAEVVPATLTNIVKSYIADPDEFHKVQGAIEKALGDLVEAKILLLASNTYRITSDVEQRLLDEMNGYTVQNYIKKKQIMAAYKAATLVKQSARIMDGGLGYDFFITTDNEDELTNPPLKHLKLKLTSLYNISDDRVTYVESLRLKHQNDKDLIWLVPDSGAFVEIDKLIEEIERITYLEQKFTNPQSEESRIVRDFDKDDKESRLKNLVEESLQKSTAIYLYNVLQLAPDTWQSTLQSQQRNMIQNVYCKRLDSQIANGDDVAAKVIKEATPTKLQTYFHSPDFQFFDSQGNFVGSALKVTEEILFLTRNTFVDGSTLEKELVKPPTGFVFGTVMATVAALMRGGKVMAKHNGSEKFSWRDDGVNSIFAASQEFRKTSFKAIAKSLSAQQRNEMVTILQSLNFEGHTKKKVNWNNNDFELVADVQELAKLFGYKVDELRRQNTEFDNLFAEIGPHTDCLCGFTGAISATNYIEKAEAFLTRKSSYSDAVQAIEKVEKFSRNNLPKLKEWKTFVTGVGDEMTKAAKTHDVILQLTADFTTLYGKEVVKNFAAIQQTAQKIKDAYFDLLQKAASSMAEKYAQLQGQAEELITRIGTLPPGLNERALKQTQSLLQYAKQRTHSVVEIEYDIHDKHTRFTYSEMLSSIDLYHAKKTELDILKTGLITEAPPEPPPGNPDLPPVVVVRVTKRPASKLKVGEYKRWLKQELYNLAGANDNDDIEVKE